MTNIKEKSKIVIIKGIHSENIQKVLEALSNQFEITVIEPEDFAKTRGLEETLSSGDDISVLIKSLNETIHKNPAMAYSKPDFRENKKRIQKLNQSQKRFLNIIR